MEDDLRSSGDGFVLPGWVPAPPERAATLWAALSAAHRVIERKQRYFEIEPYDELLADQLALLSTLHDWIPVTELEVDLLRAPLRAYVTRGAGAARSAAREINEVIREMARVRGRWAPRMVPPVDGPGTGT